MTLQVDEGPPQAPEPAQPPRVVFWFKVYAGASALGYAMLAAGALVMFFMGEQDLDVPPIVLWVGASCEVCFAAAFAASLFPRPREWVWIFDFMLICLGLVWLCCLPVSIPLLVHWLKPETRAWFGKT